MVYINLSLSLALAFLRLFKTINRFYVLYFPKNDFLYQVHVTKNICLVVITGSFLSFLPIILFPAYCSVEINNNGIVPFDTCSRILYTFFLLVRVAIAVTGFILGILTVIAFRKYIKNNKWTKIKAKQERALIIQVS